MVKRVRVSLKLDRAIYSPSDSHSVLSKMKGSIFTLFLFSVLFAISEVRSEEIVKLCGLEYRRTVIYICASSRWKRHLEGIPQAQQGNLAHLSPLLFIPALCFSLFVTVFNSYFILGTRDYNQRCLSLSYILHPFIFYFIF